ncbi:MAG: ROK family glucokinase [Clostridia bacterium]|nr:ROK family glucokinase [Clostridia bacterium]
MYYVGVDIGGMSIKTGIVSLDGKILHTSVIPTEKINPNSQIKKLADDILRLLSEKGISKDQILGIGVGCPGAINSSTGKVHYSSNLKWTDFPLKALLEEYTGLKVRIANDADAATIGEIIFGVGKEYSNVIMITIGTGIGGGIVINKRLYQGTNGVVAELGHISLRNGGLECGCGRRGCYEQYASATALIRQTKESMQKHKNSKMWDYAENDIEKVSGKTAFLAAKCGDRAAKRVVEKYVSYLSEGILDYCNIFRPDAFILGGGISKEGRYLTDKVVKYLDNNDYGYPGSPRSEILTASLGNDAGILGAASLIAEGE